MKKEFLVNFSFTTSVIADVSEDFEADNWNAVIPKDRDSLESIIVTARNNILKNPEMYLYDGNAEIEEIE